ncbi:MAG TPA: metalloregulator ArsR/SmtB family transcription factor [Candidatus Paceibacterota bacterium]|nr:metalloregulator ArsR/SmtB family transcription factor [Candidatus Paceibacterota bacterium]HMO82834.1 metalloregulator ArsR/SmtB family transcription factor [Candidatus Paceibacterota bacterium]
MLTKQQIESLQKKLAPLQDELALCEAFRILGDWSRYRIMKTLLEAKELCVSDISEIVGISMSATSQHLRILEMSGLVESERMGQMICYKPFLEHSKIKALIKLIS